MHHKQNFNITQCKIVFFIMHLTIKSKIQEERKRRGCRWMDAGFINAALAVNQQIIFSDFNIHPFVFLPFHVA